MALHNSLGSTRTIERIPGRDITHETAPVHKNQENYILMIRRIVPVVLLCMMLLFASCGKEERIAEVGRIPPDFSLVDMKGKTWKLSDLKGQVVFVNFWATWCPPCRSEMPSMQKLHVSMPEGKFKMLTILYNDKPETAAAYADQLKLTFPILLDPDGKIGKAYGLTGVPETYIVDKEGVLRHKILGPREWNTPTARKALMEYIEG